LSPEKANACAPEVVEAEIRWVEPEHWIRAPRRLARGIEAIRQLSDRLAKALRDHPEMRLIARDQRRVGLGGR
jgi:hypothetical protein